MAKTLNGVLRLREPGNNTRFKASFYTIDDIGGGGLVVNELPDVNKASEGTVYLIPNSDGVTYTSYIISKNEEGTKIWLKDLGSTTQVIDNLDSDNGSAALSANLGRLLNINIDTLSLKVDELKEVEAFAIAKLRDDLVLMGDKLDAIDASFGDINSLLDDLIENP